MEYDNQSYLKDTNDDNHKVIVNQLVNKRILANIIS